MAKKLLEIVSEDLTKKLLEIACEDSTKKRLEIASEDLTKKLLEIVSADPTKYCYVVEIASEYSTKIQKCFKIAYEDSSEKLFWPKSCLKLYLKI